MITFELFFEVGLFLYQPIKSEIIPQNTEVLSKIIYVNKTIGAGNESTINVYGVGIHEDNTSGELVEVVIGLRPGTGRILTDVTFHSYGEDLQDSLTIIKSYAEDYTNTKLDFVDLNFRVLSTAHTVQGSSASAAMEVGLIALIENRTLRSNTVMTGTLRQDGRIIAIDGLNKKIEIAQEFGIKKMLIPQSQCSDTITPKNMQIVCVSNIQQALNEMLI